MTQTEIENLFNQVVSEKSFGKDFGFNKNTVYNYRKRPTSFGQKLEVLFNCNKVGVEKRPYFLAKTLN